MVGSKLLWLCLELLGKLAFLGAKMLTEDELGKVLQLNLSVTLRGVLNGEGWLLANLRRSILLRVVQWLLVRIMLLRTGLIRSRAVTLRIF